jgi:hypothetical protein
MARLYDLAMRDSHHWQDAALARHMGEATVIDATSLSDYLYANEERGEWNLLEDFFNIAPPFERFWIECRAPQQLKTPKGLIPWPSQLPKEWGVLFLATEVDKLDSGDRYNLLRMDCEPRWLLQAIVFAKHTRANIVESGAFIEPQFSWWFPVLPDGSQPVQKEHECHIKFTYTNFPGDEAIEFKPSDNPSMPGEGVASFNVEQLKNVEIQAIDGSACFWNPGSKPPVIEGKLDGPSSEEWRTQKTKGCFWVLSLAKDIRKMSAGWAAYYSSQEEKFWLPLLQPCLMAVCFMHVKNVVVQRVTPPRAVQKKALKRHGRGLCNYHVLQIRPFKKVLEATGNIGETGIRRALHICKGHFSFYGDKWAHGKLFGKYEGAIWVPDHLRGSVDEGIMDKMYKIAS